MVWNTNICNELISCRTKSGEYTIWLSVAQPFRQDCIAAYD